MTETESPPVVKPPILPAAGLHPSVPFDVYRQWPAANHSLLKHFERSALHAKYAMENPKEMTAALRMGHALHCATFEPARFLGEFIIIPKFNWSTEKDLALSHIENLIGQEITDRKMKKDDALALVDASGKTVLDDGQHADLLGMGDAIRASKAASKFVMEAGQCEVSCLWSDAATGMPCKGRFDKMVSIADRPIIVELKSTRNAQAGPFARDAANFFYAAQAAHYRSGCDAVTEELPMHVIIAVESAAPYGVAVYRLGDSSLQTGELQSHKWLERYAECLQSAEWPGYPDKVQVLDMPVWAQREESE